MRSVTIGLIVAALVLGLTALGWYLVLDYGHEEQPQYNPGIDIDIDRAKPRPPLKQAAPKGKK